MKFKALKNNGKYNAGQTYDLKEDCPRVAQYVSAGILEPIKNEAKARKKKVTKPAETK